MKILKNKLKLNKNIIWLGIGIYILLLTAITWFKYYQLGYNALDLAIFNNIFFNAANGNGFWSSIQGHHYFADHFAPWLYALLPIYWLWQSPLNLLIIQSVILSLSAWPIYLIAKKILNQKAAIILSLAWLLNPLVWNINLHEWHILPLAIPLILLAYYFYLQNNLGKFTIFILLAMLVREDVAIVTGMFSILALLDKKKLKWIILPGLLSGIYFLGTMKLISFFTTTGTRFAIYYQWLINTTFIDFIKHILSLGNLEMILGLTLAFLFLPFLKPKYLILALGPFLQFVLGRPGGSNLMIDTHYSSLFIPGLVISSLWAIKILPHKNPRLNKLIKFDPGLTKLIIVCCLIYLVIFLGPGLGVGKKIINRTNYSELTEKIATIPIEASVATGYSLLPILSSRINTYSLHYIMIGKEQFSENQYFYTTPDYILIDSDDLITYELQFSNNPYYSKYYPKGLDNIRDLFLSGHTENYSDIRYTTYQSSNNLITFEQAKKDFIKPITVYQLPPFTIYVENNILYWEIEKKVDKNYFIAVTGDDYTNFIKPINLLTPTSLWSDELIYKLPLPISKKDTTISIQLLTIDSQIEIDSWRGIKNSPKQEIIGEPIEITLN